MKTEQLVDLDPLTGEPLIYEEFPEFDEDAEPSYISARESYESPKTDDPASSNEEAIKLAKRAEEHLKGMEFPPLPPRPERMKPQGTREEAPESGATPSRIASRLPISRSLLVSRMVSAGQLP